MGSAFVEVSGFVNQLSMRVRRGLSMGVPMPADVLLTSLVMLAWVRLESRPFHIPPRTA